MVLRKPLTLMHDDTQVPTSIWSGTSLRQPPNMVSHSSKRRRSEASAQALRCARGAFGPATIREGRRTVELSPVGALSFFFDCAAAIDGPARLAAAVAGADSLEAAEAVLAGLGIRSELAYEREMAAAPAPPQ